MHYEGTVIRPPSEAGSIILQVTVGCSHNRCTFCGAYKNVRFRVKEKETVDKDIDFAAEFCLHQKKVFLADGDAFSLPQKTLEKLFEKIRKKLPHVRRISLYANGRSIRNKSCRDLQRLKNLGLDRVYLGVESGDDRVLSLIKKSETSVSLAEAGKKIVDTGLFLSTTVILGLAEKKGSVRHSLMTADLLNEICPHQIAALTLIPLENTEIGRLVSKNIFIVPTSSQILNELKLLIDEISVEKTQFMANHASNYLPLIGRLQKDKIKMISQIDEALNGTRSIIDENHRTL